jgi:hypothetical protein
VGGEGAVDFRDDGVGEALFTQLQDRVEGVGAGAQLLAFPDAQFVHQASISTA